MLQQLYFFVFLYSLLNMVIVGVKNYISIHIISNFEILFGKFILRITISFEYMYLFLNARISINSMTTNVTLMKRNVCLMWIYKSVNFIIYLLSSSHVWSRVYYFLIIFISFIYFAWTPEPKSFTWDSIRPLMYRFHLLSPSFISISLRQPAYRRKNLLWSLHGSRLFYITCTSLLFPASYLFIHRLTEEIIFSSVRAKHDL